MSLGPDDAATPDAPASQAEPPVAAPAATPRASILRREAWVDAVLPTILLRGVILVYAFLSVIVIESGALGSRSFLEIWNRWDAPHFIEVAAVGYVDPARIVLFPVLPALIRIGSLVMQPLLAGMVISLLRRSPRPPACIASSGWTTTGRSPAGASLR